MKFDFSVDETSVLLTSLIQRRNSIKELVGRLPSYEKDLSSLEAVMEKLFPGSVELIRKNEKAA